MIYAFLEDGILGLIPDVDEVRGNYEGVDLEAGGLAPNPWFDTLAELRIHVGVLRLGAERA